ncbi:MULTISPECIES: hypothetical protein [Streptomyces]|uniref:Uncharacterized protein n=1 Tax=Streptomyces yunnanensis TaxID=156453 RepID=A0ABY8AML0_9ACTN|nr:MULTISPECIES: hypothetical protein [Streptomyces]WEB44742.1 hypothetical protein MOV08_39315 [Streptomyces yunnanensis]
MYKLHKAAVLAAALGSIVAFGAGTAHAGGRGGDEFSQHNSCRTHDLNVDVLGEVGVLNGLLANALGGEGSPSAQATSMGSSIGCNNSIGGTGGEEGGGHGGEHGGGEGGGHGGGEDGGHGGGEGGGHGGGK